MDRYIVRSGLLAMIAVELLGGAACGSPSAPATETSVAQTASPAATTAGRSSAPTTTGPVSPPASPPAVASPVPIGGDVMPFSIPLNGTYRTSAFRPAFRFTAPVLAFPFESDVDDPSFLPFGSSGIQSVLFIRPTRVIDPASSEEIPVPRDLAAWLQGHPGVRVTSTGKQAIGGKSAERLDVVIDGGASPACDQSCLPIAPLGGDLGPLYYLKGEKVRFLVVDLPDGPLLISVEAYPGDFPRFAASAERLLDSVRFLKS